MVTTRSTVRRRPVLAAAQPAEYLHRVAARCLTLSLVVALAAGCSIGDIRRTPPGRVGGSGAGPAPVEVREVRVPVTPIHFQQQVEFSDAEHGYVLMVPRCGTDPAADPTPEPGCAAWVFATADGGRSWRTIQWPGPAAIEYQLYADGDDLVLLSAGPRVWYVSRDAGRSFSRHQGDAPPAGYHRLAGRFQISDDQLLVEWTGERFRPLSAQPPFKNHRDSLWYFGDRLTVAGAGGGLPRVVESVDQGVTWREMSVAGGPVNGLYRVEIAVSHDGADVWLFGLVDDPLRFPVLWRLVGGRWVRQEAAGVPAKIGGIAPLGDGMLAVTGSSGTGVVTGGRYTVRSWPLGDDGVRMLDDGTLLSVHDGAIWLGLGQHAERHWVKLILKGVAGDTPAG